MKIREPKSQSDIHFAWNSYLLSNPIRQYLRHNARLLLPHYFQAYHAEFTDYIRTKGTLRIAVADSSPDVIMGWVAGHPGNRTMHLKYLYIKSKYRQAANGHTLVHYLMDLHNCDKLVLMQQPPRRQHEYWEKIGATWNARAPKSTKDEHRQ